MNLTYLCVVINSFNSCMIHGDCQVLTILVFRSATNTLLHIFHNALDHNDSSALQGHFTGGESRDFLQLFCTCIRTERVRKNGHHLLNSQ